MRFTTEKDARAAVQEELEAAKGYSTLALLDALMNLAYASGASDLHIDPFENKLLIRLRVDGLLIPEVPLPIRCHDQIILRLKVLAGLRSDVHSVAQDGRFRHVLDKETWVDVRVSIVPTYYGENAVLRLLTSTKKDLTLAELGLSREAEGSALHALSRTRGMILIVGPTGCGKTTTLYSMMQYIAGKPLSLVTIEDPIEYSLPGAIQVPAQEHHGLTFATGLRSILRQDPDVIMVGEVRDSETARLAIGAGLTGHLVISTLHANDTSSALSRLMDLSVEPYLIASTVSLVVAQRLVRKICQGCREQVSLTPSERNRLEACFKRDGYVIPSTSFSGAGCSTCKGTGYRGRIGIFEILKVNTDLQGAIHRQVYGAELRRYAQKSGLSALEVDGLRKVAKGLTTTEELLRIQYDSA